MLAYEMPGRLVTRVLDVCSNSKTRAAHRGAARVFQLPAQVRSDSPV
jgi:hypothetical protein